METREGDVPMSCEFLVFSARRLFVFCACAGLATVAARAQSAGTAVYRDIDAAVQHRVKHVAAFTDVERYDVYRGHDETNPVAEVTVKATYRRGVGRSYQILSQSGSDFVRRFGLIPLLKNENQLSQPGNMEHAWFTSENYEMKLKSDNVEPLDGRLCYELAITPKHKAPNAIEGTLWVDAKDFSIVKVEGVASRRPSFLAGTTRMMREYTDVNGFPMATHARAVANGHLIGRTVVTVEYSDYHLVVNPVSPAAAGTSLVAAGSE
jgi:hypothetical protein